MIWLVNNRCLSEALDCKQHHPLNYPTEGTLRYLDKYLEYEVGLSLWIECGKCFVIIDMSRYLDSLFVRT